ncbi:hypothetical protein DFH07DRAFT_357241 [Mycena maculata]|uniref:Uncharacterized protein n=1 Tax=Mycena maculata TaxID=230809 RepID=A0AAD7JIZ3_9AGAR|nr:hypothetical protein DFH07DRAFT_357241 [Mycena maculata]
MFPPTHGATLYMFPSGMLRNPSHVSKKPVVSFFRASRHHSHLFLHPQSSDCLVFYLSTLWFSFISQLFGYLGHSCPGVATSCATVLLSACGGARGPHRMRVASTLTRSLCMPAASSRFSPSCRLASSFLPGPSFRFHRFFPVSDRIRASAEPSAITIYAEKQRTASRSQHANCNIFFASTRNHRHPESGKHSALQDQRRLSLTSTTPSCRPLTASSVHVVFRSRRPPRSPGVKTLPSFLPRLPSAKLGVLLRSSYDNTRPTT